MSTRSLAIRAPGLIAAALIVLAACSPGTSATTEPTASASPPTTTPSTRATAPPSSPTTVSPAPSASAAQPIPDGDYVTGAITKATAKASIEHSGVAITGDVKKFLDGWGGTQRFTMRFQTGAYTLYIEQDGQDIGVGDRGTFAFPDDHTLVEQSSCVQTYSFSLHDPILKLTEVEDSCGRVDLEESRPIFESTPWTRKP